MDTISAKTLFAPPSRLSLAQLDESMSQFGDRIQSTFGSDGLRVQDLPVSPWGGNLSDLGISSVVGGKSDPSSVDSSSALTRGNDFGASFIHQALAKSAPSQQPADPQPPPFPGSHGDIGDYVQWATFWDNRKAKFPGVDASFPEIKEYARDWLIEIGIDYAKERIQKELTKALTDWLQSDYLADAMGTAASQTGGVLGGLTAKIQDYWNQFKNILSDPGKWLSDKFFSNGLPYLANLGIDKLFGSAWGVDAEKGSAFEYVAHMAAKAIATDIVDSLLSNVTSFKDLANNFLNLQSNLLKKIDEFFNGRPFQPGKATLPVTRQTDKDDKVDFVITGLPSVFAVGLPTARVADLLFPSGKPIVVGSATVLAGGLPLSRQTSPTAVPSTIASGAATVLVEGASAGAVSPGGGLYCPDTGNSASPQGYQDVGAGQGKSGSRPPNKAPDSYEIGTDGTKIPVYKVDLGTPHSPEYSGGIYDADAQGPYILVNDRLPPYQQAEEIAHELSHANDDYANRPWLAGLPGVPTYDGNAGSPIQGEINAREKEIEAIKANRTNYPSAAYQKRLSEEQQRLDALKTFKAKDIDDLAMLVDYCKQEHDWENKHDMDTNHGDKCAEKKLG